MAKKRISENQLVRESYKILSNQRGVRVCLEAPMLGRSIDLALYRKNQIISIEFKLNDWRKAIKQARDYLMASDFVYICMPKRRISPEFCQALEETGVGLLFPQKDVRWPFETIIEARQSDKNWIVAKNGLKAHILAAAVEAKNGSQKGEYR